ncbi:MAG: L-2-hydroxyglutarate oxidase [Thermodesulfobacteriota bacterium]
MKTDIVVVGAGIVGLATALQLKKMRPGLRVLVVEKEGRVAAHQTGNNSGVIHSGIYYKPGSLKARTCREGYRMLLDFCRERGIPFELCGKIIVATSESELQALDNIYRRGIGNGLEGLRYLGPGEIRAIEPHAAGIRGILVPQTGIVDFKAVAEKYAEAFAALGGEVRLNTKVTGVKGGRPFVRVEAGGETFEASAIVNCAGLYCDKVAAHTVPDLDMRIVPFRGEYYSLKTERRFLVRNLIYPVPDPNFPFLGVHFTRRIDGGIEAGPNAVLACRREGYGKWQISIPELVETLTWKGFLIVAGKYWRTGLGEMVRSFSKSKFTEALQKLIPEIRVADLAAGGAGVRAQACGRDGGLLDDFHIRELPGQVHVLNAPSPAATGSLAIGKTVAELALKQL